jgi:hypothetical protein
MANRCKVLHTALICLMFSLCSSLSHFRLIKPLYCETFTQLDRAEELNSFFVTFTLAMQRAFFAYCREHGAPFDWLKDMILPSGVELTISKSTQIESSKNKSP